MMNKGWLFLGALLATGTAAVVWNVMDEITTICEDYDYAMQHPEEDIVLPPNDSPNMADLMPPFDSMSTDWSASNLEGWWRYQIPEEYRVNGGYLPDVVQVYLYCLCDAHNIDYAMVLAMIEVESGYRHDAIAKDGGVGYMQVMYKWHADRLEGQGEEALRNPYVNLRVAVEYLAELSDKYIAKDEVLTAYNYGVVGAKKKYFNQGKYHSPYSDKVLEVRKRILKELDARKTEVWYRAAENGFQAAEGGVRNE